ncbi:hypothetical protein [Stappia sp. ES.058]|uniref:hypothetical protein n=1 Tax=Stappia sp. ES.058 TaxID=1881061 RepID=UPI0008793450|nr:hypothetical protein [Stappia sp. ES.058]SDT97469.1 hypothetical protein SAMN05428979_0841 [Stappia sp. ES.058]
MDGSERHETATSTLSYVLGTLQFCREALGDLDAELSADVDDIINKIGGRILLNQEASHR